MKKILKMILLLGAMMVLPMAGLAQGTFEGGGIEKWSSGSTSTFTYSSVLAGSLGGTDLFAATQLNPIIINVDGSFGLFAQSVGGGGGDLGGLLVSAPIQFIPDGFAVGGSSSSVPEPGSVVLLALGGLGLAVKGGKSDRASQRAKLV